MSEVDRSNDANYAGSIPALYDECLGPFLFEPYAVDLAARLAHLRPGKVLETAAGTGIATERLVTSLPEAQIFATDLNQDMLDVARMRVSSDRLHFRAANAQELPYADGSFDVVACQFGAMFFPKPKTAYSEARRVLADRGKFLFTVWDAIEANPASHTVELAVGSMFPSNPPRFLSRAPYGYYDEVRISRELRDAGFTDVQHQRLQLEGLVRDPSLIAQGLCAGSPLGSEIKERGGSLEQAVSVATDALRSAGYNTGSTVTLSALVWIASA